MKKVAIVVGHWPTSIDGGAFNDELGVSEFDFNNKLAPLVAEKVRELDLLPVIIYRDTYEALPGHVNNTGADVCIELHCNAANGDANGSEVLFWHTSDAGGKLADNIQRRVVSCLDLPNRGIKPIDSQDNGSWLVKKTAMPCVIVEPFFIDCKASLELALTKIEELAQAIADGINDFF